MSFEIPLSASQATIEAGKLTSAIDLVSTSLKNAVAQSDATVAKLQAMAKQADSIKSLATQMDALGNSVRKLQADILGQSQALTNLEANTKKATAAHVQYAQQVLAQRGRITTALEKEASSVENVLQKRLASDKAIIASARETSAAIISSLKLQQEQADKSSKAWATAQVDQVNSVRALQKSIEQLNKTLAALDTSTRKAAQESTKAAAAERTRAEALAKAKSEQRAMVEEVNRAAAAESVHKIQLQQQAKAAEESARAIDKLRNALNASNQAHTTAKRGFQDLTTLQASYQAGKNQLSAATIRAAASATEHNKVLGQTEQRTARLNQQFAGLSAAYQRTRAGAQQAAAATQAAGAATAAHTTQNLQAAVAKQTLLTRMIALTAATGRLTVSHSMANQATSAMRAGMIASGTSFGIFTSETIVAAVAVYGLVSAMKAAIVEGATFEDKMVRAFAIMGVTDNYAASQQLTEYVREIGNTTKFTATQAAEGLVLLGMAGLNTQQAIDALEPTLNIASIGMVDMAFAADLVTNVMNEFGMQSTDIAHIADVLAVAVTDANVNVEQLGLSLSYIGPIADSTNNSLEDTVAMIQVMGDNAIKASRAGTALRRAMANLQDPNEEMTATMVRLGVSIKNIDGEMIPLIDFMKQLAASGAGVNDVFTLFGLYAAPGMQTILKDLQKGFDENGNAIEGYVSNVENYAGKLSNIAGEASKLRQEIENTTSADAELLTSALSEVALTSFDEIHAQLRSFLHTITDFVKAIDPESIQNFTRGLLDLGESIGTLVMWGVPLFALWKTVQAGITLTSALAVSTQAMAWASGSTVGPLTAQATAVSGAALAINSYTPAALRGAAATTILGGALAAMSTVIWPLMALAGIAFVVHNFASAQSTAAEDSARLRAEMGAQAIAAQRLKKDVEDLTEAEKKKLDLSDQARIDANNNLLEEYQERLRLAQTSLRNLTEELQEFSRLPSSAIPEDFTARESARIDQLKLEIIELQDLISATSQDSEEVKKSMSERDDEYNGGRASRITASQRAAEILANSLREADDIMSGLQNAMSEDLVDIDDLRNSGKPFEIGKLIEEEVEKSDARLTVFETELERRTAMEDAQISLYAANHENVEFEVLGMKRDSMRSAFDDQIAFIDAEIAYGLRKKSAFEQELSRMAGANIGGAPYEEINKANQENAKSLHELMQLRAEYVDSYRQGNSTLDVESAKLWVSEEQRIRTAVSSYAPLQGALITYTGHLKNIQQLVEAGHITDEEAAAAIARVRFEYENIRTPLDEFAFRLEEEIELLKAQEEALRSGNFEQLVALQLKQEGITATEAEIRALAQSMEIREDLKNTNKNLKEEAGEFQKAWEEAISRVDEAFENAWAGAFDSFTDFRDNLIDAFKKMLATIAHHAITKPILVNFGVMPTGAPGVSVPNNAPITTAGLPGGVAPKSTGSGASGYLSLLSGSVTGTLGNVAMFGSDMLGTMGFKSASQAAYRTGSTMAAGGTAAWANMGLSAAGGMVGGYAGNKLGEAVFGKEAESSIGATVLGVLGSIMGPWGAMLGAALGSVIDVAFGGDGKERVAAGFSIGDTPEVRSKYEYGTQTFDSGLQITNIARRVDQEVSDKVTAQFALLDSAFTSISEAADIKVDLSKARLTGSSADAGSGASGSFFGVKDFNGLGNSEEQMAAGMKSFVQQLIGQVSGNFSEDVRTAIENATGTAEEILEQYAAVLSLDQIFKSGSKLFTNIDTFGDTMQVLSAEFMKNGESLGEVVTKIKSANDSLAMIGLGDGSSDYAKTALDIADAAGGVENLDAMIRTFTDNVIGREQELENVTTRLKTAVQKQFAEIGLSADNFNVDTFRAHFDQVKDSLDAVDVVKLIQAGNALGLLTEMEKELAAVREESFSEFSAQVDESVRQMADLRSIMRSIDDAIADAAGTTTAPQGPLSDSIEDQLDYISRMQDYYQDLYDEQMDLERELHKQKVENYKDQIKLSKEIDDYLNSLSMSDLTILTSQERRDQAYARFNTLASAAEGGDLEAAAQLTEAAKAFLEIERERETTSDRYVASYTEVVGRLSGLKGQFGLATDPGEFNPQALPQTQIYIGQMEGLKNSLDSISNAISLSVLQKLDSIDSRIALLPQALQDALRSLMSSDAKGVLNYGASLGVMDGAVVNALKLLPDESQLSSLSIAQHIENMTHLSQFPNLLSGTLSDSVGNMLEYMAAQGNSLMAIADAISKNSGLTAAANIYITQQYGPGAGSVEDYTTAGQIGKYLDSVTSQDISRDDMARQIFTAAKENGISASELAAVWNSKNPGEQYSAADLNRIAQDMGLPMFANGGVVSKSTLGVFGEGGTEAISPIKDYTTLERENLVEHLVSATNAGTEAANRAVVTAINKNTEAVRSGSSSGVVHIKVVTVDGKVIAEEVIDTMKKRSKNGEIVVHAKGVGK